MRIYYKNFTTLTLSLVLGAGFLSSATGQIPPVNKGDALKIALPLPAPPTSCVTFPRPTRGQHAEYKTENYRQVGTLSVPRNRGIYKKTIQVASNTSISSATFSTPIGFVGTSTSTFSVAGNYKKITQQQSKATSPINNKTTTKVFDPFRREAVGKVCSGQTWTDDYTKKTTDGSPGLTQETKLKVIKTIEAINVSKTVLAGTFNTFRQKEVIDSSNVTKPGTLGIPTKIPKTIPGRPTNSGSNVTTTWVDIATGVPVLTEVKNAAGKLVRTSELTKFLDDITTDDPTVKGCLAYSASQAKSEIKASWSKPNEEDTYSITVPGDPGGGYVTVKVTQGAPRLTPRLVVLSGGQVILGLRAPLKKNKSIAGAFSVHPGMTYSVKIDPFHDIEKDAYPIKYMFNWEYHSRVDCFEHNNAKNEAKYILLDDPIEAYAIAGYQGPHILASAPNTFDWYKIKIENPLNGLKAEILNKPSDMKIVLRFEDQNRYLSASGDPTGNTLTLTRPLAPGTYYIGLHNRLISGSRKVNLVNDPLPDHFDKKYKLKVTGF